MTKKRYNILQTLIFFIFVSAFFASANQTGTNYGLYFNAEKTAGPERTNLNLNNGAPIKFKREIDLNFKLFARQHSFPFGSIAHFTLDNGQIIRFVYSSDENDKFRPTLIYNNALTYLPTMDLHQGEWIDVSLKIFSDKNKVKINYADIDTTIVVPVNNAKSVKITLGRMEDYNADVLPMNVRDVRVVIDGKDKFFWKLGKHDGNNCLDSISRNVASASNPKWLIDNHRNWNRIFTDTINGNLDTAFDPLTAQTYIIRQNGVQVIGEDGAVVSFLPIDGSHYTATSSGHTVFDPASRDLVVYSLASGVTNRFSTTEQKWISNETVSSDPLHYNHARAYNPVDSSFYLFGGYGHFAYRNDLFKLSPATGKIEQIKYSNPIPPRFGATMAAVGNKLYILGGRGNEAGKQALDTYFYYDLWEIDLKTKKARKVWECQRPEDGRGWMMASSMFTLPDDKDIYAVNMDRDGGTMMRWSLNDTTLTDASGPILNTDHYQNFDFSLYYSKAVNKFFLIINKISIDKKHTVSIYTLDTPLLTESELNQTSQKEESSLLRTACWIAGIVLLLVAVIVVIIIIRRKRDRKSLNAADIEPNEQSTAIEPCPVIPNASDVSLTEEVDNLIAEEPVKKYYDTSKSCILLVGGFTVKDKDGNDITISFTPKLKEFLLLMILASIKSERGITVSKVTEAIWYDKEGSAARNTRNVTVSKLRMLLETIGDIELSNSGGFLKLNISDDVYCDYTELHNCSESLEHHSFSEVELYERVLEILLGGALLPNSAYPWLDEYKSSYSSLSIDLLTNLLHKSLEHKNDKMVLRIVRVMFVHDPLNEEALSTYCRTLVSQGKRGIAKKVYDRFCKEFQQMMGEPYAFSFNDVLNGRKE